MIRQKQTQDFWKNVEDYDLFYSDINIQEIDAVVNKDLKFKLNSLLEKGKMIEITSEVNILTKIYIREGIIPEKYENDALLLALTTVHSLDILISWNFKYLVKRKTRIGVNLINLKEGNLFFFIRTQFCSLIATESTKMRDDTYWRKANDDFKLKKIVLLSILLAGIITSFFLVGFSFKQVDFNEYALKQNIFTKEIDNEIYEEGFHFVGFWEEFIKFPSTYITVEFTPAEHADDIPISVQTKNGLLVYVDVSFQFRIRKADLLQLYSEFGTAYKSYVQAVARSALREVVGQYNAETLYANRSAVNNAMSDALFTSINSLVDVGEFQLRSVSFPQTFEDAVEQYEVWRIEVEIAQLEQEAEVIRQRTLTLVEQFTANRTIIEYEGIATALELMREALNMTTDQMLSYLWIQTIREHDQSYLFIGLSDIPILIPINGTF